MPVHRPWSPAIALLLGALAAAAFAADAGAAWRPPVDGAVARLFDLGSNPFEGGRHRGVDFAVRAGERVRAPCRGPVVVAGRVGTSGLVVTVRCDGWRVSHLPLATIAVHRGAEVRSGAVLGTAAPSSQHHGLHLGVRREGDRFGYVDPLRFLAADRLPPPAIGGRRGPPVRTARPTRLGPAPRAAPARLSPAPAPAHGVVGPAPGWSIAPSPARGVVGPSPRSPALEAAGSNPIPRDAAVPWPAWVGLALVLAGLGGVGVRRSVTARSRRRTASALVVDRIPSAP